MNTQQNNSNIHWGEMQHESKAVHTSMPVTPSEVQMTKTESKRKGLHLWRKLAGVVFVIAFIAVGFAVFAHHKTAQPAAVVGSTTEMSDANVISAVEKIILVPDETPTVLTVPVDMSLLAGNPFFAHAAPGDKVLVFQAAQEVFLFDPHADKVLAAGPLGASLSPQSGQQATSTAASAQGK